MNDLAELINVSMISAYDAFRRLMRLSSNSVPVLRMYASFLIDLANEPDQARALLARAEELEDQQSKEHTDAGIESSGGALDDRHAIVSISADPKKLGQILQVNATALRLLGYNKHDLVNRNVSMIIPTPFSLHHQTYLRRYLDLGDSAILNKSRAVFATHKSGFLLPVNLFVREVSGENEHAFLGVMRESVSPYQSAIVDPAFNIHACTAGLMNVFGGSVEEMHAGSYHLSRWLPNFEASKSEMMSPAGAEVPMTNTSGATMSVRLWLSALPVVGEGTEWFVVRAQVSGMTADQ
jgi:PAS domain S-box-containing protein